MKLHTGGSRIFMGGGGGRGEGGGNRLCDPTHITSGKHAASPPPLEFFKYSNFRAEIM